MELAYGNSFIELKEKTIKEIGFNQIMALKDKTYHTPDFLEAFKEEAFEALLCRIKPKNLAIVVEDQTRKNPEYPEVLKVIINKFKSFWGKSDIASIYLVVAYGTHKKHEPSTNERLYGKENLEQVTIVHHDCYSKDLVLIGDEDFGLRINPYVANADFVMTIGSVKPHAFAGFTGGRKAILPGVASYDDIRNNHAKVMMDHVKMGELELNPLHLDMQKHADLVNVHYSVQMVKDTKGHLVHYVCGDQTEAFMEGTKLSREICTISHEDLYDVAVVSVGGLPKDASLYQSQRAITTAVNAVKNHGLVFVVGQLESGIGNDFYETWLEKPIDEIMTLNPEDIQIGIHSAYLMAKNFVGCAGIYLRSDQNLEWVEKYHFKYLESLEDIYQICVSKFGESFSAVLIPNGSDLMLKLETEG